MNPFDPRLPIIAAEARVKPPHVLHCFLAMREMGKSFHLAAFAQFAGLEDRHVERIIEALKAHKALPGAKREAVQRGARLALDWTLPEEWKDYARDTRRWSPDEIQQEADAFADYWHSQSGQRACKVDWQKTWQNWVRNSRRADGTYSQTAAPMDREQALINKIALYERMGRPEDAGELRQQLQSKETNVVPLINRVGRS